MVAAFGFLTVLGRGRPPSRSTPLFFPLVGVVLGLTLGGLWELAEDHWPALVAASLVLMADAGLTGMLHLDGLADSGDGLLAPMDRARRLEVMAQPDVGAFGMTAVVLVCLTRLSTLASTEASVLALAGLWALSRTVMAVGLTGFAYVRPGGLGETFRGASPLGPGIIGVAVGGACLAGLGFEGLAMAVSGVVAGVGTLGLARRRLGGVTGDVLGAAGVMVETVGLIALAYS